MDVANVSRDIHDTLKGARTASGMAQEALALALGVTQPRVAEFEARLRDGRPTKQVMMLLEAAAALGLVPMFVPKDAADAVRAVIEEKRSPAIRSVWDEVFVDLGDDTDTDPVFAP